MHRVLQDHLETLQDEVSFKDGQQVEYNALLRAEKEQVAVLEEELQVGGGGAGEGAGTLRSSGSSW